MLRLASRARFPLAFVPLASPRVLVLRLLSVGAGVLIACIAASTAAADSGKPFPHVRAIDREVLELLRDGCRRSPTLQRLVDRIEQSDVIVYLEATGQVPRSMQAYLHLAGAAPTIRIVRIALRIPASSETLIAQIGHELQHATEIAAAPEVRDQAAMDALYRRIGDDSGFGWDTAAARLAGKTVLEELRRSPRSLKADAQPARGASRAVLAAAQHK